MQVTIGYTVPSTPDHFRRIREGKALIRKMVERMQKQWEEENSMRKLQESTDTDTIRIKNELRKIMEGGEGESENKESDIGLVVSETTITQKVND